MNARFDLLIDRLAADGFDQHENETAAIQTGDGDQIHQPQVDGDDDQQIEVNFKAALLGLLRHQRHHAYRPRRVVQPLAGGKELAQTFHNGDAGLLAQRPRGGQNGAGGHFFIALSDGHAHPVTFQFAVVLGSHGEGLLLTVPENGDFHRGGGSVRADGVAHVLHGTVFHFGLVDPDKNIPGLQPGFGGGHSGFDLLHHRGGGDRAVNAHQRNGHDEGQHEVHARSRKDAEHPFPNGGLIVVAGIVLRAAVRVVVRVAVEHAVATHRNGTDGKSSIAFLALVLPDDRAEAQRKFLDSDAAQPRHRKVAELVHHDQDT